MQFEWDDNKEKLNIAKHGIDFSTAALIFRDPMRIELYDETHSAYEDRYITMGRIDGVMVVIIVVYTHRSEVIRLISARKATAREERTYYDYTKED